MPDSVDTRLREAERAIDRMDGRLSRVDEDMRVFRPIPLEKRAKRERLSDDVHEAFEIIRQLRVEFTEHREDVLKVRAAREEREREREKLEAKEREARLASERRDRWARWATVSALTLTFVSMTVGWAIIAF